MINASVKKLLASAYSVFVLKYLAMTQGTVRMHFPNTLTPDFSAVPGH
jgi:hypothetical protein